MFHTQTFIILGLFLEAMSVIYAIRKQFYGYYRRLEEKGTFRQAIRKNRIDAFITLLLFSSGLAYQVIAIL